MRNRFERGTGCFHCEDCGKLTRNTTGIVGLKLCARCLEKAEDENSLSDGCISQAEFDSKWNQQAEGK